MNQEIKRLFEDDSISDEQLAAIIQAAQSDSSKVGKSMKDLNIQAGSKEHLAYMRNLKEEVMHKHGYSSSPEVQITGEELANPNWTVAQWQQWDRARRIKSGYKPNPLNNIQDGVEYFKKLRGANDPC